MAIRSDKSVSVTVSGRFDIEDLIKELRDSYPAGRRNEYTLDTHITVYKAADHRDSDSVTFHMTPKPKTRMGTGSNATDFRDGQNAK